MIDFRYHVVSIIAVLLALAIGVMFGSGFVGGRLIDRLGHTQRELQRTNVELREQLRRQEEFIEEAAPLLTGSSLLGEDIVVITLDGTDGGTSDGARGAIERAGGQIVSSVTMTDKLELESPEDRAELGALLGSDALRPDALRRATGEALGTRLALAGEPAGIGDVGDNPSEGLSRLVETLGAAGYLTLDGADADAMVTNGAHFLVLAGAESAPTYDPADVVVPLAASLSERGDEVVAAEPLRSGWGVVDALCAAPEVSEAVTTVDHADETAGRVALVLALDKEGGAAAHYGVRSCSSALLPARGPAG